MEITKVHQRIDNCCNILGAFIRTCIAAPSLCIIFSKDNPLERKSLMNVCKWGKPRTLESLVNKGHLISYDQSDMAGCVRWPLLTRVPSSDSGILGLSH